MRIVRAVAVLAVASMTTTPAWNAPVAGATVGKPQPPPLDVQNPGTEFRAPDGSFTCRVPSGWKARSASIGTTPVHVLEPDGDGDERILVASGPATATTIQDLAQQAMVLVVQQLIPGLRPTHAPVFSQSGDGPVAEISYTGVAAVGQVTWWQRILLKDGSYYTVLGGGRVDRAQWVEQQCRSVFHSIRPAKTRESTSGLPGAARGGTPLAAAIVGTWTFYDRSGLTRGSVSKQVTFHPSGRFEYLASTHIPNLPSGVDPSTRASGTYRLSGTTLTAQFDDGQQATFTLQLVQVAG